MAGNNGASTPEDDDPFGYLYEDGQAAGAQPPGQGGYGYPGPAAQPGVPRTSYNQVRTVGERQYGQQVPQQTYGQPQQGSYGYPPASNGQYGQPNTQYAAPETYPGAPTTQVPHQGGRGNGGPGKGGPNTKGLLIGAVAVVAVVLIGIGAALMTGDGDKNKKKEEATSSSGAAGQVEESPKPEPTKSSEAPVELPKQDAASLKLGGTATVEKSVKGAEGPDGSYVSGFNAVGSSVTWRAAIENAGSYRLTVRYAIPGKDANATLTVNGKSNSLPIGLKDFIKSSDPDWEKNWQTTWAPVDLVKGENEIKISCEDGNQCDVILDWVEVTSAQG
ncbi:CBM35 domain-containing protein [Streptomyces brevispora]|uniref:Carbohydrate-binding protein n=1 Tax=Streptomyces brevispora TaxID=887462 RepID=A0A561UZE5_9ACTN|nr:CBM35 domain-containing protein [Streptomyces brevispora]TWG04752.1 carbohydrate-binding protein with CBM35 doain [Streptomyces brevispora]WSC14162.1 carbohydrate-binding protein [Streptomyces brevispora]